MIIDSNCFADGFGSNNPNTFITCANSATLVTIAAETSITAGTSIAIVAIAADIDFSFVKIVTYTHYTHTNL